MPLPRSSVGFISAEATTTYTPLGVHLVGSLPVENAERAFRVVGEALGDRVRRIPDGETGPRSDWIVWQYPVLSARPEFEIGPPELGFYRPLPRLKLRADADVSSLRFESLGYATAARASFRDFARLKRDGVIPSGARFQVSLPTPLAPISAFVALADQQAIEEPYEDRMLAELDEIIESIPADQLAVQWDTNFEFGMLEGAFPAWFEDVSAGVLERLLRISRRVPSEIQLGFHLCYGDTLQGFHREQTSLDRLVEITNALSLTLGRPLNWLHMPIARERTDPEFYSALANLRTPPETEVYLGIVYPEDGLEGARRRIDAAASYLDGFGVATECGWGRRSPQLLRELLELHHEVSRPVTTHHRRPVQPFKWPKGFQRIPGDDWVSRPVDAFGQSYDKVDAHGWYRNLDPSVEQLAAALKDGQLLVDYSGGTGILLDRLRLRIFDRQVGMLIVDSSPKFLRVALERFHDDARVALRLLRYLKEEKRLEALDEVIGPELCGKVDVVASTNAIHLYTDLPGTLAGWRRVLRPGGRIYINSGNIRNPEAKPGEWILDETVYVVHELATGLVRTDPRFQVYRGVLDDPERVKSHLEYRDRVFVAPRPLEYYTSELEKAGFQIDDVSRATITADVDEWYEFLKTYHEAVLGWIGGSLKIEGKPPSDKAVDDRVAVIREAMAVIFGGRKTFRCCWTYITGTAR